MNRITKKHQRINVVILLSLAIASMNLLYGGLYFVSSVDFRKPILKYVVETTEPNQEVEVTPYALKLLSTIDGASNYFPYSLEGWQIKYDGINQQMPTTNAIRQKTTYPRIVQWSSLHEFAAGTGDMNPITHTFANPGRHLVSIYSPSWNVFATMISNSAITEVSIDLEYLPGEYVNKYQRWGVSVVNSPNVTNIIYKNPIEGSQQWLSGLVNLANLKKLSIKHLDKITVVDDEYLKECVNLEETTWVLPNLQVLRYNCFRNCKNISYVSIPRISVISGYAFSLSEIYPSELGLQTLRIGDGLEVAGKDLLARQTNIKTIEFVTDEVDWVSAWNNHPILPNWLGPASNQSGNEATLTPLKDSDVSTYYSGSFIGKRPKPTKLVYAGGYDVN